MEEEADALKNLEALEELYMAMHEYGIDDLNPYLTDPEAPRTEHFQQPLPPDLPLWGKPAPHPMRGCPEGAEGVHSHNRESRSIPDYPGPTTTQTRTPTDQTCTEPSNIEQIRTEIIQTTAENSRPTTPSSADSSATGIGPDPPRLPSTHGTHDQAQSATRP